MKLEEILFGLIGTGGCWRVFLKTEDGEGYIYIRNGVIVRVEYKDLFGEFEGEEALKVIVENSAVVKSVDLQPCSQKVEQNVECDFSKLMLLFEKFKTEEELSDMLSEVESDVHDIHGEIKIVDNLKKFKEVLDVCAEIFSDGSVSLLIFFDRNGIAKIDGDFEIADLGLKTDFLSFMNLVKEICEDSDYTEIVVDVESKFIYTIFSSSLFRGLTAIIDITEKANFELDQDTIRNVFKRVLEQL